MKLYHGTSETAAKAILAAGEIKPRGRKKSNWKEHPSKSTYVYMTTAYALYFGMTAIKDKNDRIAVFEIDLDSLDEDNFRPDEDFIEQYSRKNVPDPNVGLKTRTANARKITDKLAYAWEDSLEFMGTMAHCGAIPKSAISRVAIFDPKLVPMISMSALDPAISHLNYKFCGDRYKAITRWLFTGLLRPEDFFFGGICNIGFNPPGWEKIVENFHNDVNTESWKRSTEIVIVED